MSVGSGACRRRPLRPGRGRGGFGVADKEQRHWDTGQGNESAYRERPVEPAGERIRQGLPLTEEKT